jgi:hypothetical protein
MGCSEAVEMTPFVLSSLMMTPLSSRDSQTRSLIVWGRERDRESQSQRQREEEWEGPDLVVDFDIRGHNTVFSGWIIESERAEEIIGR